MRHAAIALLTSIVLASVAASCGTAKRPDPALTVKRYLSDLGAGRYTAACAALTTEAKASLRENALSGFRATAAAPAERLRQVQAAHRRAASCEGAHAVARDSPGGSAAIATALRDLPQLSRSTIGPGGDHVTLGANGDWGLVHRDGRWLIEVDNVFP